MTVRRVRQLLPRGEARAPRVVIDEAGSEVAVLIDYGQYLVLLDVVASQLDRSRLSPYWRAAMADCLQLADGGVMERQGPG